MIQPNISRKLTPRCNYTNVHSNEIIHCVQAYGWGELATERVEACVDEMSSWMRRNKLQLNDSKTEVMIICSVHNHSKVNIPHIQVGDSEIQPVQVQW